MKPVFRVIAALFRTFLLTLEGFLGFLLTFWWCTVLLSHWSVAAVEDTSGKAEVTIYVTSNGVHSDFVVPVHRPEIDWGTELGIADSVNADTSRRFLAFGWGNKGFFLQTKNWSDLRASVLFQAAFHLGTSAMHVVQVAEPQPGKDIVQLQLTQNQYRKLVAFIKSSFREKDAQYELIAEHPYGRYNYFFEANRSYGLFYTCNSWTNSGLKACGQRAVAWTALKDGIFDQYEGVGKSDE